MFRLAYSSPVPELVKKDIVHGTLSMSLPERLGIVARIGGAISDFGPITTAIGWPRYLNYESLYTFLCLRSDVEAIREELELVETDLHGQKRPRARVKQRNTESLILKLCMRDHRGLLAKLSQDLSDLKINICNFKAATSTSQPGQRLFFVRAHLECPIHRLPQLQHELARANAEDGWDIELSKA